MEPFVFAWLDNDIVMCKERYGLNPDFLFFNDSVHDWERRRVFHMVVTAIQINKRFVAN